MNAVGVKLGNGWYSQEQHGESNYGKSEFIFLRRDFLIDNSLGPPRLYFSLLITLENGDEMQVVSDQTWTGREGSIKHDSIYNGEFYDSRNDRPNWSKPGFNDPLTTWIMPEIMPSPLNSSLNGSLVLQDMLPIRAGPDALHFEVMTDSQEQGYLNAQDIGEIKGANLTDGGILKPVAMWISHTRMFSIS
jgi:hypothetical protein